VRTPGEKVVLPALEPLEVSTGIVLGSRRSPESGARPMGPVLSVRNALADLLVPFLESDPCFVSFSGGRDSAALLALATHLARTRGLADPIPVTLRFQNRPRSDESRWQEMTIDRHGLRRWEIVTIRDELDPLGPNAKAVLRRHGLFWPPVAHRIVPLLEVARGHVLVFGTGGDEAFSPWQEHAARRRLDVRVRPFSKALRRAAFNCLPEPLRMYLWFRRRKDLPWLRPAARRELHRRYRALLMRRTRGPVWAEAIQRIPDSRNFELTQSIFGALARDAEVTLVQPFFDPAFLRALVASTPRHGFPSRAAAMRLHFGDVLPLEVAERPTKAVFDELHGGREAHAFAAAWNGEGLDAGLVDPEALRAEWSKPSPEYRSLTALNAAWVASPEARRS
jgi:asparagine synthase (glutamine-hydrolysing)